jgi:hypothetical protein
MEALSFLKRYNPQIVGGVERILQVASDLAQRREQESSYARQPSLSLGARFNMWRGTTMQSQNTVAQPLELRKYTHDYPDSDETETSGTRQSTLASAISNTFWRGITNQSAMEDELPSTPPSPSLSSSPLEQSEPNNVSNGPQTYATQPPTSNPSANIWGYAEKLKSSDTVASLSKVSTNWRAKALLGSWGLSGSTTSTSPSASNVKEKEKEAKPENVPDKRFSSMSFLSSPGLLSPPPVPPKGPVLQNPQPLSPPTSAGLLEKTKALISIRNTPKSAPKPLLLSGNPIISSQSRSNHPRSASATSVMSTPETDEWADVMRGKGHNFHRDSQSSVSSLSPSDAFGRIPKSSRSEYESDTNSSRIVSINRRSISPMAPNFRVANARSASRPSSRNSSVSSGIHSPPLPPLLPSLVAKSPLQESSSIDSQPFVLKPEVQDSEDSDATSSEMPTPARKPSWTLMGDPADSENASPTSPIGISSKSSKLRSKRVIRLANLQIQELQKSRASAEQKTPSPSKLTVEWPTDDQENIKTPKASNFDSDDYVSVSPVPVRSPRRPRKMSSNDQEKPRKSSMDTIMNEERPRKISTSNRTRKVSTGSREVPRSRRESAAEDGDDEGYDELLSAYESEEGPYLRS